MVACQYMEIDPEVSEKFLDTHKKYYTNSRITNPSFFWSSHIVMKIVNEHKVKNASISYRSVSELLNKTSHWDTSTTVYYMITFQSETENMKETMTMS